MLDNKKDVVKTDNVKNIKFGEIPDKYESIEYKNGNSVMVITNRYDGISETFLQHTLHTHNYCEFEAVYGGNGVHILHKSSFEMCRGCAYLRMPNNFHTTHQDKNDKLKAFNIGFSLDFIPSDIFTGIIMQNNALCVRFNEEELLSIIQKIKLLTKELKNPDNYSQIVVRSVFSEILVSFIRKYKLTVKENLNYSYHIQNIINYINNNYRDNLSVEKISSVFGLNKHYAGSLFIKEVGCSIPKYILELRLVLALQLLKSSAMSVNEIAFECGFSSPAYFISKFRERYGLPPKKYIVKNNKI